LSAESLIAFHGFTGHAHAFACLELGQWFERPLVPTLLGHGPRPQVLAPTFEAEVERLLAEIERLPAPRRLLGYSQGARLALGVLTAAPDLIDRALLIAPQPGLQTDEERRLRRKQEDAWIAELEDRGVAAFVDAFCQLPLFGPARDPRELRQKEPFRWDHTALGLTSALLVLGTSAMPNLWPKLALVRCPLELWVGELDHKYSALAEAMTRDVPQARLVTFPGAHHNPVSDCPALARTRFEAWAQA
jgi:2-succinyl-6-hydroxy-2,4-cyclohexadiene-1-carboxylate synthase